MPTVTWDAEKTRRVDDGSDPHRCHYRAAGTASCDGQLWAILGEATIDLRDGSPEAMAMTPADLAFARVAIVRKAKRKALYRALRALGGSPSPLEVEAAVWASGGESCGS